MTWKARLRDLLLVALAFAIGAAALTAYTAYRIWVVGQHDNRQPVDAIVVLGAAQYNGRPSAVLAARLDHAIELYKEGYAPWFVVTGGKLPGDVYTEAATERNYAVAHGVPASAILGETTGGTTLESIRNVKALLDLHGLHTALFVSDRTHMLRVLRLAQDQGIEAWGSPTTTSPADTDPQMRFDAFMHEMGALAQYGFLEDESPADQAPASTAAPSAAPSAGSTPSSASN
ncbi:MAG: YdcF family protein [Candidatus Limnocylindrales bacterium]